MSRQDFEKLNGEIRSLQPPRLILQGYSGGKIDCLGEKVMTVQINNQKKDAVIRIVDKQSFIIGQRFNFDIYITMGNNFQN